jgi:molecular chaperone GrpE
MSDAAGRAMSEASDDELMNPDVDSDLESDTETDTELAEEIFGEISELEALTQERDQFKDIALRLQADFENYRKRMAAQSVDEVDRATGRLAEVGPLLNAMLTELKKHGLETLDLEGQPFDPAVAEAVTHEPVEGGDILVAEVMRSGYRWKGRTLRPAMVRTRD